MFDNALVLPEYLVEFDYVINQHSNNDLYRLRDGQVKQLNDECKKMFGSVSEAQKVLKSNHLKFSLSPKDNH